MMRFQEKIDNLTVETNNNLNSAKKSIENERVLHGLFYCHLVIQKILRAIVIKTTNKIPSKTLDLNILLSQSNIKLEKSEMDFIDILIKFHIQGRYPTVNPIIPDTKVGSNYISQTENLLNSLKKNL